MPGFDVEILRQAHELSAEAALDQSLWPDALSMLAKGIDAQGAFVIRGSDGAGNGLTSPLVKDCLDHYFHDGWSSNCFRINRGLGISLQRGVVSDLDFTNEDEIKREPLYQELLAKFGLKWFAALMVPFGADMWAFSIQRTHKQGAFTPKETAALLSLRGGLITQLRIAEATDRIRAQGMVEGLATLGEAAVMLDGKGRIVEANDAFVRVPSSLIRNIGGKLVATDKKSNDALQEVIRTALKFDPRAPDDIKAVAIPRLGGRPLVAWACPVRPSARTGFRLVHALVVIRDLAQTPQPPARALAKLFAMTPAEVRVAQALMNGGSLKDVANEIGISWNQHAHS